MLLSILVLLLFSNAVTFRRDKSILFSRIVITGLILTSFLAYDNLYITPLQNGVGIYGGLFNFRIIEYSLIIVFIICGAVFLITIELQSYGLYILSTLYRNSESSTASGLTYFLLGGLSSCFILLGSALIYINSGTTNLDNIYVIANIISAAPFHF
ncbi:hypothetical protein CERZMDRAFT_115901 [Cercospora zeae-maydis SCOH1-5]|uniref:NADH-ubiquinone oxidoreductase chain 2 n=1 Tax=Cercospora zeae-maydis SCOH1-5 TaxID=717836 RepID=A0A6A6EWN8_9PEZI|nr:hypothetical protein CERZMDRAFT_115901 [Cercospora zeae-maydis SCOH1-5]